MTKRHKVYDFGFDPEQMPHHFAVVMDGSDSVSFVERLTLDTSDDLMDSQTLRVKATLDICRWSLIASAVADDFNRRMNQVRQKSATWKQETLLAPHFGKELVLLVWAVEDATPETIPFMIANWMGLAPEERWWLYTTINATSDHPQYSKDRGWRKAIKIAFAENPTHDLPRTTIPTLAESPRTAPVQPVRRRRTTRRSTTKFDASQIEGQAELQIEQEELPFVGNG